MVLSEASDEHIQTQIECSSLELGLRDGISLRQDLPLETSYIQINYLEPTVQPWVMQMRNDCHQQILPVMPEKHSALFFFLKFPKVSKF